MRLCPLTIEDAPAVHALAASCLAEAWSESAYRALPENPVAHFFTVKEGDTLLAFGGLYCMADECELVEIVTDPAHRRKGIARALLSHLLSFAKARGAKTCFLEVRAQNTPAQALYTSFGFAPCGRRKHYYQNPTEDALLFSLSNF